MYTFNKRASYYTKQKITVLSAQLQLETSTLLSQEPITYVGKKLN